MSAGSDVRGGARGYTLIELITVIVLVGILVAMVSEPLTQTLRARTEVASDLDAIAKLRYATERIVREMRQIQYLSGSGFRLTPLDFASSTSTSSPGVCFSRVGGLSGATVTNVSIKLSSGVVTYEQPGTCSTLGVSPPTLVDGVSSLAFDFYAFDNGSTGNPIPLAVGSTTFANDVTHVAITLTLSQNGGTALSHRTLVFLRNGGWSEVL
jgi:prepilin-type N-terminal cleavage/methylation domain-containing protein